MVGWPYYDIVQIYQEMRLSCVNFVVGQEKKVPFCVLIYGAICRPPRQTLCDLISCLNQISGIHFKHYLVNEEWGL